ncbi:MAG TPA: hypothetical protein VD833_15425 [Vicinamibacterales bacterium]|nr:hypothetical protein [Vicinamibacterales bacterium]
MRPLYRSRGTVSGSWFQVPGSGFRVPASRVDSELEKTFERQGHAGGTIHIAGHSNEGLPMTANRQALRQLMNYFAAVVTLRPFRGAYDGLTAQE